MLDIGWQELFIISVIAVIVIGPKDLPRTIKTVAQYVRKARGLAREFQSGLDDMVREAELDDLKKELTQVSPTNLAKEIGNSIDPTGDLKQSIKQVDPTAQVRDALTAEVESSSPRGFAGDVAKASQETADAQSEPAVVEDASDQTTPIEETVAVAKTQAGE